MIKQADPYLGQLMLDTGLSAEKVDELYNVSRVGAVDLNNITFLDIYYKYNHKVSCSVTLGLFWAFSDI